MLTTDEQAQTDEVIHDMPRLLRHGQGARLAVAISFPVAIGTMLLCVYQDFKVPEMVKRRPTVVVSPRLPHRIPSAL